MCQNILFLFILQLFAIFCFFLSFEGNKVKQTNKQKMQFVILQKKRGSFCHDESHVLKYSSLTKHWHWRKRTESLTSRVICFPCYLTTRFKKKKGFILALMLYILVLVT